MNKMTILVGIQFFVLIFSAQSTLSQSESSSPQPSASENYQSYFSNRDKKRFAAIGLQQSKGGESGGGGGETLELKFAMAFNFLLKWLEIENPHNLSLPDFRNLVDHIELDIKDEPLYLDGKPKDAINYFPQSFKVKIYRTAWEKLFLNPENGIVYRLLYHELLPYFFGNDFNYIRSRDQNFSAKTNVNFNTFVPGHFSPMLDDSADCIVAMIPDKIRRTVEVTYLDNHLNGKACSNLNNTRTFQCDANGLLNCVDVDSFGWYHFLTTTSDQRIEIANSLINDRSSLMTSWTAYYRLSKEPIQTPMAPIFFEDIGFHTDSQKNYSAICKVAFERAKQKAISDCIMKTKSPLDQCEVERSEPVRMESSERPDRCYIKVIVKKLS